LANEGAEVDEPVDDGSQSAMMRLKAASTTIKAQVYGTDGRAGGLAKRKLSGL
jgi:hypothetical protein